MTCRGVEGIASPRSQWQSGSASGSFGQNRRESANKDGDWVLIACDAAI